MQFRQFGQLDFSVSALGFGCMRLPTEGSHANIDEAEAIRMLHVAIDHGLNYVDTAYPYHEGTSETLVGKALEGGYRNKVRLATKLPCWEVRDSSDFDRLLNEQCKKLNIEYIDFYLLHSLTGESWPKMRNLGVLDWLESVQTGGRIGKVGFSFHDNFQVFKEIIDAYSGWNLCQIQYNYMDVENQAGEKGLKYAAAKGLAIVIMEGLLGGYLVNPPAEVQCLWDSHPKQRSCVDWAFQWLWNQPEVSLVLSGMSTMTHVKENLESANRSGVNCLTENELQLFSQIQVRHQQHGFIGCTGCQYCLPCPQNVAIPEILSTYNQFYRYRGAPTQQETIIKSYREQIAHNQGPSNCVQCNSCLQKCPQGLPIPQLLARSTRYLDS